MDMVALIDYDAQVDILAIKWKKDNSSIKDEKVLDNDIVLDYDDKGELVGLEVWNASKRGLLKTLADLAREKNEVIESIIGK